MDPQSGAHYDRGGVVPATQGGGMDFFGIGSIVGGLLGYKGVKDTNAQNAALASQANTLSNAMAERQMGFQEQMSNTAYQRAVVDMQSAGLNPMLAYQQGGSSTPSGASGSAIASHAENPMKGLGEGVSTALQLAQTKSNIDNTEAMTDKNEADAALARATIPRVAAEERAQIANAAGAEQRLAKEFPHLVEEAKYRAAEQYTRSKSNAARFSEERGDLESGTPSRWSQERDERSVGLKLSGQELRQRERLFPYEVRSAAGHALAEEARGTEGQKSMDYNRNPYGGKYDLWLPDLGSLSSSAVGAAAGARLGSRGGDWFRSRARRGPVRD